MACLFFLLFVLGPLPFFVSAHGYIGSVTIGGTSYPGNQPGGTTNPSIIRQVSTISPVKGADNPSLYCGMNATLAANVANVDAGAQILVHWVGGATGDENWPHNTGPVMHYMTKCSGSCATYDSSSAEWFKISELGVEPDDTTWYMANIAAGEPANVTIPSSITTGEYLLRSELIALQLAMSVGGAEFYPGCIQLSISGSGSGAATSSEECEFPGCYTDTEPGIYDPNVYNPPLTYTFPGPPVAAFVGNSGSQGGVQPSGSAGGGSSATPTASSSASPSGSTVPTDTSSPSSPPMTMITPTASSSVTPLVTPSSSNLGKSCYVTSPTPDTMEMFAKRGKRGVHKRRLIRRST